MCPQMLLAALHDLNVNSKRSASSAPSAVSRLLADAVQEFAAELAAKATKTSHEVAGALRRALEQVHVGASDVDGGGKVRRTSQRIVVDAASPFACPTSSSRKHFGLCPPLASPRLQATSAVAATLGVARGSDQDRLERDAAEIERDLFTLDGDLVHCLDAVKEALVDDLVSEVVMDLAAGRRS